MREKNIQKIKEQTNIGRKAFENYYRSLKKEKTKPKVIIDQINLIIRSADLESIDLQSDEGKIFLEYKAIMDRINRKTKITWQKADKIPKPTDTLNQTVL